MTTLSDFERRVAANMRDVREEQRRTQLKTAEMMGMRLVQYQKIESGNATISVERLGRLAEVLGVDPGRFFVPRAVVVREARAS